MRDQIGTDNPFCIYKESKSGLVVKRFKLRNNKYVPWWHEYIKFGKGIVRNVYFDRDGKKLVDLKYPDGIQIKLFDGNETNKSTEYNRSDRWENKSQWLRP